MKKILYVLVIAIVASACSGPKYTASFNSYDKHVNNQVAAKSEAIVITPAPAAKPEQFLASTSSTPAVLKSDVPKEEVRKTYIQMTKTERKALRTDLRSDIKTYVKEQKKNMGIESTKATSAMDNDLKLASIFGAVGIVAMFIGGDVFYIVGAIALLVGVVFFVKWLVRQ
jgi:PBP1b-binding outer membrane lipoprotein LpoB